MKANLMDFKSAKVVDSIELSSFVFGISSTNHHVISDVLKWQNAKARSISHSVKTVSDVKASNKKPHPQKGTGRARRGNLAAPQIRGGGVSHGPVIRSFETKINKKVRKKAVCNLLSHFFAKNAIVFVNSFDLESSKTRYLRDILSKFSIDPNRPASLIYNKGNNDDHIPLVLSSRSLEFVDILPYYALNPKSLLNKSTIFMESSFIPSLEKRLTT